MPNTSPDNTLSPAMRAVLERLCERLGSVCRLPDRCYPPRRGGSVEILFRVRVGVRRGRASGELFLHGRPRSRPPHSLRSAEAQPRSRLQNFIEPFHRSVRIFLGRKLDFSVSSGDLTSLKAQIRTAGLSALKAFTCPVILPTPILRSLPPEPQGC